MALYQNTVLVKSGGGLTYLTTADSLTLDLDSMVFGVADNTGNAFVLSQGEGGDAYLAVDTTNGSELVKFGNATTNPGFNFLGSGALSVRSITGNAGSSITIGDTTHALQFPSLTSAQRDALTAADGMVIYNTTTSQFEQYDGEWAAFGSGAGDSASGTTNLTYLINSDFAEATDQDPALIMGAGDGTNNVRSYFRQDSGNAELEVFTERDTAGNDTYASVATTLNIGKLGETGDVDHVLQFNANSVTATMTFNAGTGDLILDSDTSISTAANLDIEAGADVSGGALTFTGTNLDLDPTGTFALDMDAGQVATFTISDNLADALLIQQGGNAYFDITTSDSAEAINFGNATTNPGFNFLGTGAVTIAGDLIVQGSTTEVRSTVSLTNDSTIVVSSNPAALADGGLAVERYYTAWGAATESDDVSTATAGTVTLGVSASINDDDYNGWSIAIVAGTGSGQQRTITDYDGTTKVATIDRDWATTPDNTSDYSIFQTPTRYVSVLWDESEDEFVLGVLSADPSSGNASVSDLYNLHVGGLETDDAVTIGAGLTVNAGASDVDLNGTDIHLDASGHLITNSDMVAGADLTLQQFALVTINDAGKLVLADASATSTSSIAGVLVNTPNVDEAAELASISGSIVTIKNDISAFASEGDVLYLSETAGEVTINAPSTSESEIWRVGTVVSPGAGAGQGRILFRPQFIMKNP